MDGWRERERAQTCGHTERATLLSICQARWRYKLDMNEPVIKHGLHTHTHTHIHTHSRKSAVAFEECAVTGLLL
jgi:hypothetical protein